MHTLIPLYFLLLFTRHIFNINYERMSILLHFSFVMVQKIVLTCMEGNAIKKRAPRFARRMGMSTQL